jgi:hypothetical protein
MMTVPDGTRGGKVMRQSVNDSCRATSAENTVRVNRPGVAIALQFGLLLATLLLTPRGLAGQTASYVPVSIAVVESASELGSDVLIFRRAKPDPGDIIVMAQAHATPRELVDAIMALLVARETSGDTASQNVTLRVPASRGRVFSRPSEEATAQIILQKLLLKRPALVPRIGMARTADIFLRKGVFRGRLTTPGR